MKKGIAYILGLGLVSAIMAAASLGAEAAPKKPAAGASEKQKKGARSTFQGKLSAVDKTAMTITVEQKSKTRTVHITSHTRITKAGKPATFGDAVLGEDVGGQTIKNAAGEEEAVSVRLGAKSAAKPGKKKAPKPESSKKKGS